MSKKLWIYALLFTIILIAGYLYIHNNKYPKNINKGYPLEAVTVNQIIAQTNEILKKDMDISKFHVGKIEMSLDKSLSGELMVTYVKNKKLNPDVLQVKIDTTRHIIETLSFLGNDEKVNPGSIDIDHWGVDFQLAYGKTINLYPGDKLDFDTVKISAFHNYNIGREYWHVELVSKNDIKFWADIDPYTGDIIDKMS